jgi:cell division transport system permease protein
MVKKEQKISRNRLRSSFLTSIISISLVLLMVGLVGLLVLNGRNISKQVRENIGFNLILKSNIKEADIYQLQKILDAKEYVLSTDYVSKEEAAIETEQLLGEDFVQFLGYNPLPPSIRLHLKAVWANPDSVSRIEQELQQYEPIEEVYYKKTLLYALNENIRQISLVIGSFSLLLLLISITLINNTIRLSVYSKRFIINTMQLVGATRGFIRRPFLYRSAANGIIGSFVALALLGTLIYISEEELQGTITLNDQKSLALLSLIVIFTGVFINWISTFFAVNKYLKIKTDKLYY